MVQLIGSNPAPTYLIVNPTVNGITDAYPDPGADAHPIHLHLVEFQIVDRQEFIVDENTGTGKLGSVIIPPETGNQVIRIQPWLCRGKSYALKPSLI
ncbi:MAG: multicopper oxidase domain-containing protein [Acetobacterium sp.]